VLDEQAIGTEESDARTLSLLTGRHVYLVILAGYLRKVGPRTLAAFEWRMLNTHPAPLPRFGGRGMYGTRVDRAVLAAGVDASAATIHLVDADYDTGLVLADRPVPVLPGDDIASLQARTSRRARTAGRDDYVIRRRLTAPDHERSSCMRDLSRPFLPS
jgi:phosphoribosylglycinamide formyltransferase-1